MRLVVVIVGVRLGMIVMGVVEVVLCPWITIYWIHLSIILLDRPRLWAWIQMPFEALPEPLPMLTIRDLVCSALLG